MEEGVHRLRPMIEVVAEERRKLRVLRTRKKIHCWACVQHLPYLTKKSSVQSPVRVRAPLPGKPIGFHVLLAGEMSEAQ